MKGASGWNDRWYWIVSPNVRDDPKTVADWRQVSLLAHAAFMGYGPYDWKKTSGPKFAGTSDDELRIRGVHDGDVVLIARSYRSRPEVVGFGIVQGKFKTTLKSAKPPQTFGSLRILKPFVPLSGPPPKIPLGKVLNYTKALARIYPDDPKKPAHKELVDWLKGKLGLKGGKPSKGDKTKGKKGKSGGSKTILLPLPSFKEEFQVRYTAKIVKARQIESKLVTDYERWLEIQDRKLTSVLYSNKLKCDAFEKARKNLIEAKSANSREHLRMAIGQLLDYEWQGRAKWRELHKAILVPDRPSDDEIEWLQKTLGISLIWREKGSFLDSANGQFT